MAAAISENSDGISRQHRRRRHHGGSKPKRAISSIERILKNNVVSK